MRDSELEVLSSVALMDFAGLEPKPVVAAQDRELPEGFEDIFGPRPKASDFAGTRNPSFLSRVAIVKWEQDLRYFKRAGLPPFADDTQLDLATRTFVFWDMGYGGSEVLRRALRLGNAVPGRDVVRFRSVGHGRVAVRASNYFQLSDPAVA